MEIAAAMVRELEKIGRALSRLGAGGAGGASADRFAARDSGRSGDSQVSIFAVQAQTQRIAVAHADDRRGEPAQDPPRPHGEHQPADHAGRHAGRFPQVDRLSQKVVEMVRKASKIRAKTAAGTDLTADLNPNYKWLKTSGIITPRNGETCPAARFLRRRAK